LGRFRQLRNLGTQEVTIMWDGEWRALVSALDAAELLEKIGLKARIALLPADRDPNEVLPEVVRQAFWSAKRYSKGLSVKWRLRNPYTVAK
jgi:DNA primase